MTWEEHFIWDERFTSVVGKTAIGRATIEALHLNRRPLKNLRRALIAIEAPPLNRLPFTHINIYLHKIQTHK